MTADLGRSWQLREENEELAQDDANFADTITLAITNNPCQK